MKQRGALRTVSTVAVAALMVMTAGCAASAEASGARPAATSDSPAPTPEPTQSVPPAAPPAATAALVASDKPSSQSCKAAIEATPLLARLLEIAPSDVRPSAETYDSWEQMTGDENSRAFTKCQYFTTDGPVWNLMVAVGLTPDPDAHTLWAEDAGRAFRDALAALGTVTASGTDNLPAGAVGQYVLGENLEGDYPARAMYSFGYSGPHSWSGGYLSVQIEVETDDATLMPSVEELRDLATPAAGDQAAMEKFQEPIFQLLCECGD